MRHDNINSVLDNEGKSSLDNDGQNNSPQSRVRHITKSEDFWVSGKYDFPFCPSVCLAIVNTDFSLLFFFFHSLLFTHFGDDPEADYGPLYVYPICLQGICKKYK